MKASETTGEQAAEQSSSCQNGRPMYEYVPLAVRAPISQDYAGQRPYPDIA
jgi:hypothetical protein